MATRDASHGLRPARSESDVGPGTSALGRSNDEDSSASPYARQLNQAIEPNHGQ
jgi:hypothetical protein